MKILATPFKEAVKGLKAEGSREKQRVIVRAEAGRLVLMGIGPTATEALVPLNYEGETKAVLIALAGLRWVSGVLVATDEVELELEEKLGLRVVVSSWQHAGRNAELKVSAESVLAAARP